MPNVYLILKNFLKVSFYIFYICGLNKSCTKGISGQVSIDTLNQHLDGYLFDISINTQGDSQLTLDQQSVDSLLSVDGLVCIDQKLVDCQPTVNQDVDGVLIECQPSCRQSVNQGY